MIYVPIVAILGLITITSYLVCFVECPFKKSYNNHFLHIPIIIVLGLTFLGLTNYFSPTANNCWRHYSGNVGIIHRKLDEIDNNIANYNFTEARATDSDCVLKFTDKITGDEHSIWVHDDVRTYMHWYMNGQLVIKNGTRDHEEFPGLHESMWVCSSLNRRIFEKVEDIIERIKRYNISKQLGTPILLSTEQPQTKTMEITAPVSTTITAEVSQNNNIIHQEQI
jgi:hypothetical protein